MNDPALIADLFTWVPVGSAARADVLARMGGAGRHYHGLGHLATLWQRHLSHGVGLTVRAPPWHRLIACAIAFHDTVYDPTRHDNEVASAALWREAAPALDAWETEWVAGTILATADHLGATPDPGMAPEAWNARLWMLALDLSPLGEARDAFDANTRNLRAEYAHLDDAAWASGRRNFLRALSARGPLFRHPVLAAAFEAPMRANLIRELAATD